MFWVSRQSRILSDRFLVFFLPGQSRLVSLLLIYYILYNLCCMCVVPYRL